MKKSNLKFFVVCALAFAFFFSVSVQADWKTGDPHKMHFPQLPDEDGWNVNATQPLVLADDWRCSETGWVKDIHFWGSWKHGQTGQIVNFVLSIHDNLPADPCIPYSRPGKTLWERYIYDFEPVPIDPTTDEGWYDPSTGEAIHPDHSNYFQYNIFLNEEDWFWQEKGKIYWLNISAVLVDPIETQWGWKSTEDHFMDDAVWAYQGDLNWQDMFEPNDPDMDNFSITINPDGSFGGGGGSGYVDPGVPTAPWYYYENTGWWNQWFYDGIFDPNRDKIVHIEFYAYQPFPDFDSYIEVAVNWSTPDWPPEPQPEPVPPLPPLTPEEEDKYIRRETLLIEAWPPFWPGNVYTLDYIIRDYNPEWVSIDVMGYNFSIDNGIIEHSCVQSLDLAFVITGDNLDFGDLPDPTYPTLLASDGARHVIGGPWFDDGTGTDMPDSEPDGQPDPAAMGDDQDILYPPPNDDEDGLILPNLIPGVLVTFPITVGDPAGVGGFVEIWIDYNIDGDLDDPGEMVSGFLPVGTTWVGITAPADATPGMTFARGRISTAGTGSPRGLAYDGEVEDTEVLIEEEPVEEYEYGDAPESQDPGMGDAIAYPDLWLDGMFPTCKNIGLLGYVEHHDSSMEYFGPSADVETNGNAGLCPPPACFPPYDMDECYLDGDAGLINLPNGADSFTIDSSITVVPCIQGEINPLGTVCQTAVWGTNIDIDVTNTPDGEDAYVNVLVDWNRSGEWSGASDCFMPGDVPEHVLVDFLIPDGYSGPLSLVPGPAPPPSFLIGPNPGYVWARFTITWQPIGMTDWNGEGTFGYGESEDYLLLIEEAQEKPEVKHLKWSQPPIEVDPCMAEPEYCGWNEESWTQDPCELIPMHSVIDDFRCIGSMPVASIHFWGSYIGWDGLSPPLIRPTEWEFKFYANVPAPADPEADPNYSHPGKMLWKVIVPDDRVFTEWVGYDYYPNMPFEACFQHYVDLEPEEYFLQDEYLEDTNDNVYWLGIRAVYPEDVDIVNPWGWKTRPESWMDDAVKYEGRVVGWEIDPDTGGLIPIIEYRYWPIEDPIFGESFDAAFELDTDPNYIKWEQPFTGIRDWPHYEDILSQAKEDDSGAINIDKKAADDWLCERRTPVTAVVWFGSYLGYRYETPCAGVIQPPPIPPNYFILTIHQDVPADAPNNEYTFSHPGRKLWQYTAYEYDEVLVGFDKYPEGAAGPREPVYRYSVRLPEDRWFRQREVNDVYWISIMAVYKHNVDLNHQGWGWTIHEYVFGDNAVQGHWSVAAPDVWVWEEIFDQTERSADLSFILFTDPNECVDCADYNWDDIVNFYDYAIFALDWMWTGPAGGYANGDLNCNGKVEFEDLEIFCMQWLDSCP